MKRFLFFALLSGIGWLFDFATFTLMIKVFDVTSFVANFVSSFVGVTFVWFASLKTVFGRTGAARGCFLFTYWGFQFLSILAYSQLLHLLQGSLGGVGLPESLTASLAIFSKIIVTPFNLVTNFIFMKCLTNYMRQGLSAHV